VTLRARPAAEVVLAFLAGGAAFWLAATALSATDSDVLVVLLGLAYLAGVVALARGLGIAYAVPVAMAGMLAYDWFSLPPTHTLEVPDTANLVDLLAFLGVGVLIGQLAANAVRRAERSEQSRAAIAMEQAALRRVATLVARGAPPDDVLAAVAREIAQVMGVNATHSWSPKGSNGHASGAKSSVGAPIVVDGRLWGVIVASSDHDEPLPADTQSRLLEFTELVATAISNTEARTERCRLADEQAALRRVATLVAHGSPAAHVFAAVAEEVEQLLRIDDTALLRYEADGTATVVVNRIEGAKLTPVGTRVTLQGTNVGTLVLRTGRSVRQDDYEAEPTDTLGGYVNSLGFNSGVGSPIVVEGRLWGVMIAVSRSADSLPEDAEARLEEFTELIGTAISNMQARSDLASSRARIVEAADDERRRVVRDLHDGAQQRLVHTIVTLKLAQRVATSDGEIPASLVTEALTEAERATAELRELAHGILPSALTTGGLEAGLDALASRMALPVEINVSAGRLPAAVEATAYFVVAEALTNVAKHSRATRAEVDVHVEDGSLRLCVRDDGVGGAQPDGSGLIGLADRLAVLDGRLHVKSPRRGGTVVEAAIPVSDQVVELRR
jgi:signal transduction histidine kinase